MARWHGAPAATPPAGEPRFYGRRVGRRLRAGRRRLLDALLPEIAVRLPADGGTFDPRQLFSSPVGDVWLEIGFGAGEHLVAQARARSTVGFIGCEPFINGVATLLADVDAHRLDNVRVYADDARRLLPHMTDGSLDRVFMLFADPWPKRRHLGRRLIAPAVIDHLARVLRIGGEFRFASDDPGYVRWTLALMLAQPRFEWAARAASDWRSPPPDGFPTRYQQKAAAEGRSAYFLRFRRVEPPNNGRAGAERPCAHG